MLAELGGFGEDAPMRTWIRLGIRFGTFPGGLLIRPVEPRLTLAERLAADAPMEGEATELDRLGHADRIDPMDRVAMISA